MSLIVFNVSVSDRLSAANHTQPTGTRLMRMILFCLLSVAVGTDPHQNSIRALAHDIHTATHSLPSIQAWQHLQSRLSIDNVDPQTLPPGLRKEVWKVWFNLANALRSTSDSGHWNDASWIYQQLCGAPTQQSPPLPSTTTTAHDISLAEWRSCADRNFDSRMKHHMCRTAPPPQLASCGSPSATCKTRIFLRTRPGCGRARRTGGWPSLEALLRSPVQMRKF